MAGGVADIGRDGDMRNSAVSMAAVPWERAPNTMSDTHKRMSGSVLGNSGLSDFRSAVAVFCKNFNTYFLRTECDVVWF